MQINVAACDKCGKYFLPNEEGEINQGSIKWYGRSYDLCDKCSRYYDDMFQYYIRKHGRAVETITHNALEWLNDKKEPDKR
jgi:hypothetical protein